jgi:hypothetical protein
MRHALLFLMFLLLVSAAPALAGEFVRDDIGPRLWGATAASMLNAREEPSAEAAVAFQIPRGTLVAVIEDLSQPVRIDGKEDSWSFVATEICVDDACEHVKAGWVADSWLGMQDRFEKLTEWREGEIVGNNGALDFTFRIAADASFEYVTAPCEGEGCEPYEEYEGCRKEEDFREGDVCVGRGDLYQYRKLIWARGYGYLYVDGKRNLCSVFSARNDAPRMCDK